MRVGKDNLELILRRRRVRALECFFFGTAMKLCPLHVG